MSQTASIFVKIGIPVAVLVIAGAIAGFLIQSQPEPERQASQERQILVSTQQVEREQIRLDVRAQGEITPSRDLAVQPQVSGRIEFVNPNLVPGGLVEEGEVLFRIEQEDYELAVEQQQAALEQAQAQLQIEEGQQEVAQQEWELFEEEVQEELGEGAQDPSLALREPQLESARAQVASARASLRQARVNLERTVVRAPFDAYIRSESAEVGNVVSSQMQVANLVGTSRFWVQLAVPVDHIPYINIPGINAEEGSEATIRYEVDGRDIERTGEVIQLQGELDQAGRMAHVMVRVDDPLGLEEHEEENPDEVQGIPLLVNSYVDVTIQGNRTEPLIEVPDRAIRSGDEIYVAEDGRLSVREVEIAWRRTDSALIRSGLEDGDQLITSPVATPVEGMKVQTGEQLGEEQALEEREADESETAPDRSETTGEPAAPEGLGGESGESNAEEASEAGGEQ